MSVLSVYRLFRNRTTDVVMFLLLLSFLAYQVGASEQGCVDQTPNDLSASETAKNPAECR